MERIYERHSLLIRLVYRIIPFHLRETSKIGRKRKTRNTRRARADWPIAELLHDPKGRNACFAGKARNLFLTLIPLNCCGNTHAEDTPRRDRPLQSLCSLCNKLPFQRVAIILPCEWGRNGNKCFPVFIAPFVTESQM